MRWDAISPIPFGLIASLAGPILEEVAKPIF